MRSERPRGTRFAPALTTRAIGAPNVSPTSSGVKITPHATSALSSTGISITSPRMRSGARTAASSVTFAPSDVPPTTASSSSRWSSRATVCSPKSGIE